MFSHPWYFSNSLQVRVQFKEIFLDLRAQEVGAVCFLDREMTGSPVLRDVQMLFCSATSSFMYFKEVQSRRESAPVSNVSGCISRTIKLHPDTPLRSPRASITSKHHSSSQEHNLLKTIEVKELLSGRVGRARCVSSLTKATLITRCVSPLTKAALITGNLFPEQQPVR